MPRYGRVEVRRDDDPASPDGDPGPQPLEIEIVDLDPPDRPVDGARGSSGSGSRRASRSGRGLLAAAIGVGLAIALTWVIVDPAGDDDRSRSTSVSVDLDSPSPADPTSTGRSRADARDPRMPSFEGVTVPSFPAADPEDRLDQTDIVAGLVPLHEDVPRRSTTRVVLGQAGFVVEVTILRDPFTDRYDLEVDYGDGPSYAVVDARSGITYVSTDRERWSATGVRRTPAGGAGEAAPGDLYRRLLDGPIRPDTIDDARIVARTPATIGPGRTAEASTVELAAEHVPEWQLYHFAPQVEFDPASLPPSLVYDVYSSDESLIVIGLSDADGVPQLVQHEIEVLPERVVIPTPDTG